MKSFKHIDLLITLTVITTVLLTGCASTGSEEEPVTATTEENQVTRSIADCSNLDESWALFQSDETSISFCYQNEWGVPTVKKSGLRPEVEEGTKYYISFPNSINNNPLITYATLDHKRLGDSDVAPLIEWNSLDFSKDSSELAKLVFFSENATAEKLTINDKQVLKVHMDFIEPLSQERVTPVEYFMPNVNISANMYNLHVICSVDQEEKIDVLLKSLTF